MSNKTEEDIQKTEAPDEPKGQEAWLSEDILSELDKIKDFRKAERMRLDEYVTSRITKQDTPFVKHMRLTDVKPLADELERLTEYKNTSFPRWDNAILDGYEKEKTNPALRIAMAEADEAATKEGYKKKGLHRPAYQWAMSFSKEPEEWMNEDDAGRSFKNRIGLIFNFDKADQSAEEFWRYRDTSNRIRWAFALEQATETLRKDDVKYLAREFIEKEKRGNKLAQRGDADLELATETLRTIRTLMKSCLKQEAYIFAPEPIPSPLKDALKKNPKWKHPSDFWIDPNTEGTYSSIETLSTHLSNLFGKQGEEAAESIRNELNTQELEDRNNADRSTLPDYRYIVNRRLTWLSWHAKTVHQLKDNERHEKARDQDRQTTLLPRASTEGIINVAKDKDGTYTTKVIELPSRLAELLQPAQGNMGSKLSLTILHRVIEMVHEQYYENALNPGKYPQPGRLEFRGGWKGLTKDLLQKENPGNDTVKKVKQGCIGWSSQVFKWFESKYGSHESAAFTLQTHGSRGGVIVLSLQDVFMPGHQEWLKKHGLRPGSLEKHLIPMEGIPPYVGRENEHGSQYLFKTKLVQHFRQHVLDYFTGPPESPKPHGLRLDDSTLHTLAGDTNLPTKLVDPVIQEYLNPTDGSDPLLAMNQNRFVLGPALSKTEAKLKEAYEISKSGQVHASKKTQKAKAKARVRRTNQRNRQTTTPKKATGAPYG